MLDSAAYYARKALAVDSSFSGALALLANYHFIAALRGFRAPIGVQIDSATTLAHRAVALDSTSGEAWEMLAASALYVEDDFAKAKRLFEASVRLAPTHPVVRNFQAIHLGEVEGRLDSAIAMARRATELDMATIYLNTLGDLYMRNRQYDSAIAVLRRAVDLDPGPPGPQLRLITSYERTGRFAEAVATRRAWRGDAAAAPFLRGLTNLGAAGYRAALAADLRMRIDSLKGQVGGPRVYPRDTLPPIPEARLAFLYGQLEEWNTATDWVLREYQFRPRRLVLWVRHPDMQGLNRDPRFVALVRAAGLLPR
jgi:Flp pilus assembly protein TadD